MRRAWSWTFAALVLSVPLALAGTPTWAGTTWADLWQTPDQQAQHLMSAGKAAEAATRFKDERQRAYAELEAGQYANAVKHLAPFKDADSQYNRGNALARSGDLKDALSAYDEALASKPGDKDVQHNRDLVAQALQRQQQQQERGGKNRNGSQDKQGEQNQAEQGGQQQSGNESGQQSSAQNQQQDAGHQSSAQDQPATAGQQSTAQNQQMNPRQQNGQDGNQAQQKGQNQPGALRAGNKPGDEQQTERQAQEAAKQDLARANATQSGVKPHGDALQLARQAGAQQNAEKRPPPPTEQSLTLEQWLRRIPDDPGELLRRKFLVEHMQKQAGSQ